MEMLSKMFTVPQREQRNRQVRMPRTPGAPIIQIPLYSERKKELHFAAEAYFGYASALTLPKAPAFQKGLATPTNYSFVGVGHYRDPRRKAYHDFQDSMLARRARLTFP